MSNAYIIRSRIFDKKFRQFLKLFCLDLTATQIAVTSHPNRNTANRLVRSIRHRMAELSEEQTSMAGIIEVDESYFGPHRIGKNHCVRIA